MSPEEWDRIYGGLTVEKGRFKLYGLLMLKWDAILTIGVVLFVAVLSVFLFLSFARIVIMSEAVQILAIGAIFFSLVFRYFRQLSFGPISGSPSTPIARENKAASENIKGSSQLPIRITSPNDSGPLSGKIEWKAVPGSELPDRVVFKVDGQLIREFDGGSTQYSTLLDTYKLANGPHVLEVLAHNAVGLVSTAALHVFVKN